MSGWLTMDIVRATLRVHRDPIVWVFHDVPDKIWFERCVDEIQSARHVIPLTDLVRNRARRRVCAITFDDGRRSVLEIAHPILHSAGLPYTLFACTEVVTGGPVPWFLRASNLIDHVGVEPIIQRWQLIHERFRGKQDLIVGLREIPVDRIIEGLEELEQQYSITPPSPPTLFLSAEEVRTLSSTGVTIGSHTHRHPILSRLSAQDQKREIEKSVGLIENLTGRRPSEFAYPNGSPLDFNATTIAVLRGSGIQLAVTTIQGYVTSAHNPLALPRMGLSDGDSSLHRMLKNVAPSLSLSHLRERRLRIRAVP